MHITSPNLSGIPHGFFTRNGGVSEGIYASLNCGGRDTGDVAEHVIENRRRVAEVLGTTEPELLGLYQIHSADVITVTAPWTHEQRPRADAMVTAMPGLALGILTADCVPVLFADETQRVIGAAHAGWKGLLAGVLENTLDAMCAAGAKRGSIAAAIGPCIGYRSYEVGAEFQATFLAHDAAFSRYFSPAARAGHFLFDIRSCARDRLLAAGCTAINTLENDTYIEEDTFFSYRRATHRSEPDYGRQVSAITLTP